MAGDFEPGTRVEWNTLEGATRGRVTEKLTSPKEIEDQKVKASEDDPRYVVESEKSGSEVAPTSRSP